jgi:hypothetical protein
MYDCFFLALFISFLSFGNFFVDFPFHRFGSGLSALPRCVFGAEVGVSCPECA